MKNTKNKDKTFYEIDNYINPNKSADREFKKEDELIVFSKD